MAKEKGEEQQNMNAKAPKASPYFETNLYGLLRVGKDCPSYFSLGALGQRYGATSLEIEEGDKYVVQVGHFKRKNEKVPFEALGKINRVAGETVVIKQQGKLAVTQVSVPNASLMFLTSSLYHPESANAAAKAGHPFDAMKEAAGNGLYATCVVKLEPEELLTPIPNPVAMRYDAGVWKLEDIEASKKATKERMNQLRNGILPPPPTEKGMYRRYLKLPADGFDVGASPHILAPNNLLKVFSENDDEAFTDLGATSQDILEALGLRAKSKKE